VDVDEWFDHGVRVSHVAGAGLALASSRSFAASWRVRSNSRSPMRARVLVMGSLAIAGCRARSAPVVEPVRPEVEASAAVREPPPTRRIGLHLAETERRFRHGHRVRFCVAAGSAWKRCGDFSMPAMELEVPDEEPLVLTASAAACSFMSCPDDPSDHCRAVLEGDDFVFTPFASDCVAPGSSPFDRSDALRIERPQPGSSSRGWWVSLVVGDEVLVRHELPVEVVAIWAPHVRLGPQPMRARLGRLPAPTARVESCTRSAMSLPQCEREDPVPVCEWHDTADGTLRGKRLFIDTRGCTAEPIASNFSPDGALSRRNFDTRAPDVDFSPR
jgi:hypothetical protein